MTQSLGTARATPGLPTGTVTFVFSDIEGSTQRWDAYPVAMQDALRRHDALVRAAIETCGGHVFKTIGDAFCAVFSRAEDAVAGALGAQRALAAEDFSAVDGVRVRMALHTGTTDERDGDYFGPTVNRVARLLAIGHGGQVLVSGTAADLLQGTMPQQTSLRDLGEYLLKDLARPEQVYQLVAPDLLESFPALRSLDVLHNNLPRQLTSFVGRDDVVAEIALLVAKSPLVTLVGTGGAGKTRAAVQVGADLIDGCGDGVWLVELAPISESSLVLTAVAQALGVRESPNHPLLETLLTYLKKKRLLLILDNCEHVISEMRTVAAALLRACPNVRILATSREALNVGGEEVFRMPSLGVPPASKTLTADEASQYGAIALFADRAYSVDRRFTLTDDNVSSVADICRRLDGIPLALELAAARVKVLAPHQLLQKLDERFRLLTGGDRSALPRQQTMRALIDWSFDLLGEDERTLFRRLSIFADAFTLDSAGAVCGDAGIDEIAVLDLLSSLLDKSLVHAELSADCARYRLLESTRQYAREKLIERGEYAAIARAHAVGFLELAERLERTWATTPDRAWAAQVEPELEDWRAALGWAFGDRGDVTLGQRLTAALRRVWLYLATAEGWRYVHVALDAVVSTSPPLVVASLELTVANLGMSLTRHKVSYAAAERALSRYREAGDELGIAQAQTFAGGALVFLGDIPGGEARLREALAIARRLGARKITGLVLQDLALARQFAGDVAGARTLFAEVLPVFKETGAERQIARVAGNLADTEFRGGDAQTALRLAGEALAADRALGGTRSVANDLSNMTAYLIALLRWNEARTHAREALILARDAQADIILAYTVQHLAAVAALRPQQSDERARADFIRAGRLLGFVNARLETFEALREYTEQQEYDKTHDALHDALGASELAKAMDEGRAGSEEYAVAEAMLV